MSATAREAIKKDILQRYEARTPKSRQHNETAGRFLPGGDTRSVAFFPPYPVYAERGQGARLYDVDGNTYLDFVNNMTSMVNGHAHPDVVQALQRQLEKGTTHSFPVETTYRLAELICRRVTSIESLRYTNSGSEATLFAMRAARAFTGKDKFIKMDGGYHGNHDFVQVNLFPDMTSTGLPQPYVAKGIPASVLRDMLITPFNDLETTEKLLKENKGLVAAIILEPILGTGGGIAPDAGYLQGLRRLADRYEVLLIFDEIISFRVHEGGWQGLADVRPDLTTLGKVIGGGFPIGAFGGRREIMDIFNPTRPDSVTHSGTFTGNAMTMTAGLANLELYDRAAIEALNQNGDRFSAGLRQVLIDLGIPSQVNGIGSLTMLYFSERPMKTARDVVLGFMHYGELMRFFHLEMMNRGVYFLHRGMFSLCTPMTDNDIDQTLGIIRETLEMLKPIVEGMGEEQVDFKF
jgi:glutamate-1-semialdehyde 2,1-aminomutase